MITLEDAGTQFTCKNRIKVLFFPSDNSSTSGAFLSMSTLASLLSQEYNVESLIVLPNQGDGQIILDDFGLSYTYIRTYPWVISTDEERTVKEKIVESIKDCIKVIRILLLTPISLIFIYRLMKVFNPDIVHLNTSWGFAGAIVAFYMNIPVIWHIREYLEEGQQKKIVLRQKGYQLINKSRKIVAVSNALTRKYKKVFAEDKLITIYNGIDIEKFYQKKRENILKNNEMYLLCVGGLSRGKGQDQIILALAKLRACGINNFKMHFVGNSVDEAYYKDLCSSLFLSDKVIFEGRQLNTKKYYQKADIFLMASKSEAFGRVTVEAMLSGCLVIGSASGGTPEILNYGECGYLYEAGNIDDLFKKIYYVNANRETARKVAERGQEFAKVNFSASKNAQAVYKLYNEVLNEKDF